MPRHSETHEYEVNFNTNILARHNNGIEWVRAEIYREYREEYPCDRCGKPLKRRSKIIRVVIQLDDGVKGVSYYRFHFDSRKCNED